jgi:hypothetical protein
MTSKISMTLIWCIKLAKIAMSLVLQMLRRRKREERTRRRRRKRRSSRPTQEPLLI